jgi:hypothetical protein
MISMRVLRADHQMGDRKTDWVNDHADHLTGGSIGTAGAGPDGNRCLCHRPYLLVPWMGPHEPAPVGMISRYGGKVDSRYQLGKSVALLACDLLIP